MAKKSAPSAPPAKPLTREQQMDLNAARDFAAMDKINSDRSLEYKLMTEPGPKFEPQPSDRSQVVGLDQMTFSRLGETDPRIANSAFMRSRRRG
jgi:hypothetical protein